jgi:hypothetical protein
MLLQISSLCCEARCWNLGQLRYATLITEKFLSASS